MAATQHDDNPIIQKAAAVAVQEGFDEDKMELEKNMQRKVGKVRIDTMMRTMPRYPSPPIIPDPGKWYKEPCIVATWSRQRR